MSTYEIIPTTEQHVCQLAATMRQNDIDEIWAASHLDPWLGLVECISKTDETYTGLVDGKVLCIYGVAKATFLSPVGCPWLLSSTLVEQHRRAWARQSRYAFAHMKANCGVLRLQGMVDVRYTAAIRWIEWLGFTIHGLIPFGPDAMPFYVFTWEQ